MVKGLVFGVVAGVAGFVVVSCGGAQPEAQTAPPAATGTAAPSAPAAPPAGAAAWKDMNHEQRLAYMKSTVFPKMKDEFTGADAQRFADMNCATCHGAGAKDGSFKMPNPDLPKLNPAGGFAEHRQKAPKMVDFMMQKVVPDMASLLSEQPYDPKTHQGFGCGECHTMVEGAK